MPRIEGIEEKSAQIREMIPGVRLAIAHGQIDASELESIMLTFSSGEADVLVCTTIIESGLDIPRVNTILVEDSHRFGFRSIISITRSGWTFGSASSRLAILSHNGRRTG